MVGYQCLKAKVKYKPRTMENPGLNTSDNYKDVLRVFLSDIVQLSRFRFISRQLG